MTKRTGMWLGMLALLVGGVAICILRAPPSEGRRDATMAQARSTFPGMASPATTRHVAQFRSMPAHATSLVPGNGLGGEHLNLKASLDAAIAERGRDDPLVFEMARIAVGGLRERRGVAQGSRGTARSAARMGHRLPGASVHGLRCRRLCLVREIQSP